MKIFFKIVLLTSFITLSVSCKNGIKKYNQEFVNKFNKEPFKEFINTGFVVRNFDNKGNIIVFASELKTSSKNGPYIVKIDTVNNVIIETSSKLLRDSTLIDKSKMEQLAVKFLTYNVNMLKVDSSLNVFVNVIDNERPTLIRFSDLKFKKGIYDLGWKNISDFWYEDEHNR